MQTEYETLIKGSHLVPAKQKLKQSILEVQRSLSLKLKGRGRAVFNEKWLHNLKQLLESKHPLHRFHQLILVISESWRSYPAALLSFSLS